MAEIRLERKNPFYVCAHLLVSNDLISISRNLLRENKLIDGMDKFNDKYEGGYRRWVKGFKTRIEEAKPGMAQVIAWTERLGREDMEKRKEMEG